MTVTVTNNITPNYAITLPAISNRIVDDIPRVISAITTIDTVLLLKLDASKVGAVNGVASLGSDGRLLTSHLPAFSGDVSSSVGSSTLTLSNTGVAAGTYNSVTVDSKGRVTAASVVSSIPSQTGQTGKYLTTNGTTTAWNTVSSGLNPTSEKTANYTAVANDLVRLDTRHAALTVTFPSGSVDGTIISVVDIYNSFAINHATLSTTSSTIEGESSYLLDIGGAYTSFVYNILGNNWKLLETPHTNTGGTTLPSQTGQTGKYLTTDGTTASWDSVTSGGSGGGGLSPTSVKTSSYFASENELVRCNTTNNTFTVTFPLTPIDGSIIGIIDTNNTFGTHNLILNPNIGKYIEGDDTSYTLDISGTYASFMYNASTTNWRLLTIPMEQTSSGMPAAFSTFSVIDGELIVEHSSSFSLSLIDGEFIVEYT